MPRRKTIKNEARDFIQTVVFGTFAVEAGFFISNHWLETDMSYLLPPALAFGGIAAIKLLDGLSPSAKPSVSFGFKTDGAPMTINGRSTFASVVRWAGHKPREGEPTISRTIKYKEEKRGEYFWDVILPNRDLPIRIYESRLFDLVRAAERRQRFGERAPFSRNHFTSVHRPRFRPIQYSACMIILENCGLVEGRGQGASGELCYPPYSTIELAKEWFSPALST